MFIGDHKSPIFGFLGWDRGDKRASRAPTPPGICERFVANKGAYANRRLGGPCVAPGWPLGGQASPNPNQARVADSPSTNYHLPSTVFVKDRLPAAWAAGSRNTSTPKRVISYFVRFCQNHTQIHGSTAASGRRSLRMILVLHGH